ncbi:family 20 glycosylhydrolase [Pelagicoccus sp. SDUM812005]|uniref:family 20 glycosylhydrolase n=1 Tax=Pelagicoccus sp. SDUM812005 TaxID=3041257 RepID=UPI00280D0059|nr:family 20 glycosylhydrolase [Pelagicoccus sp. SDUM812005]MDQ8182172.1 family 20 glycosylhydrolase [Pelagicoccus sp. SDUM812005]
MTRFLLSFAALLAITFTLRAQDAASLPVRGLSIAAPTADQVDRFLDFVEQELAPRGINLLVLRVDYNFDYQSHPELKSDNPLTLEQVKRLVAMGRRHEIRLVPQINLLGHQSWHSALGPLLTVYPEFDETPHIKLPPPGTYRWPNEDGLYCKSYCPLHPDLHAIVFALIDEITRAFEADAFHAGLDEVFYIGDENCPRCKGRDKAELFAGEVQKLRNHLAKSDKELWIWGDRLLDAETTGLGVWEASDSGTHRAIDLIPQDVVICDWHYERAEPTPSYFALKGFRALACSYDKPTVAKAQLAQALDFREHSNPTLAEKHRGMLHTYWSSAKRFMDLYQNPGDASEKELGPIKVLDEIFPKADEQ